MVNSLDVRYYHNIVTDPEDRVFITASGPSLLEFDPQLLRNETIITVNETIKRFPWAEYSCALDHGPYEVALKWANVLFTTRRDAYPNVKLNRASFERFSFDLSEGVFTGFTTAYVALQLAVYMGYKNIYICGLDLGITDTHTHFYGKKNNFHGATGCNFPGMRRSFEATAPLLSHLNVVNCSPNSLLDCFPKIDIYTLFDLEEIKRKPISLSKPPERLVMEKLSLEKNVVQVGSKFLIKMPNGEILPEKFTLRERAQATINAINEYYRKKGGRPRKNK